MIFMHKNPHIFGFPPDQTWELVYQPIKQDTIVWRYNANKPLMGKYYFRWRKAEFSWVVMPGVAPLIAPKNDCRHDFKGHFTVCENEKRKMLIGSFLKMNREHKDLIIAGWKDYTWKESTDDDDSTTRQIELPDNDKWEYFAFPVVEKIELSWGCKYETSGKWYEKLIPTIINFLFTERGMGISLSSATFTDEPLYLGADFAVYRRPR